MKGWLAQIKQLLQDAIPSVLVTVVETKGSTPREVGAKMVISEKEVFGSIGGGHLEFAAINHARHILSVGVENFPAFQDFPLGPTLGQCCGGFVRLMYESTSALKKKWLEYLQQPEMQNVPVAIVTDLDRRENEGLHEKTVVTQDYVLGPELPAPIVRTTREKLYGEAQAELNGSYFIDVVAGRRTQVYIFGAGHVGKALVNILSTLPLKITWIDSRDNEFPDGIRDNTKICVSDAPEYEVDFAPPWTLFLVMTHSHALDFNICLRILSKRDYGFLGLIGSAGKRRRFVRRLSARGVPQKRIDDLVSPIGIEGIEGKQPEVIALAVAAQLMQLSARQKSQPGLAEFRHMVTR